MRRVELFVCAIYWWMLVKEDEGKIDQGLTGRWS